MSSKILVICDNDEEYRDRLSAFLNGKRELAFQVKTCSSPEQIQAIKSVTPINILLLNHRFLEEVSVEAFQCKTILLSEAKEADNAGERKSIFKYQGSDKILAHILECCKEKESEDVWRVRKSKQGRMIGIYSPVHRLGQTTFALDKARNLSKNENVLYLNLETYAGDISEEKEKTLSVLLYYAKQEAGNIGLILTTLISRKDGIDYIPPVVCSNDLRSITGKEWIRLFREILCNSIYDVLILDLDDCMDGLYDVLQACDTVYTLVADDEAAISKMKQYENNLRIMGYGEVAERMIRCDIGGTITGKNTRKTGFVKRSGR